MQSFPSRALILVLALPVLAVAACGGGGGDTAARSAPRVVAEPGPVSWQVVERSSDPAWVSVRPTGRDRPCVAYQPTVQESRRRVTITVVKDEVGCVGDTSALKAPPVLRVELTRPVGEREVR